MLEIIGILAVTAVGGIIVWTVIGLLYVNSFMADGTWWSKIIFAIILAGIVAATIWGWWELVGQHISVDVKT